jgi:hypothetical protein
MQTINAAFEIDAALAAGPLVPRGALCFARKPR